MHPAPANESEQDEDIAQLQASFRNSGSGGKAPIAVPATSPVVGSPAPARTP
jgi:hypothetical protein